MDHWSISYWTWGFSISMLVYREGIMSRELRILLWTNQDFMECHVRFFECHTGMIKTWIKAKGVLIVGILIHPFTKWLAFRERANGTALFWFSACGPHLDQCCIFQCTFGWSILNIHESRCRRKNKLGICLVKENPTIKDAQIQG